jgi:formamidopyrimidine-DNA glycosylase
MPELPEVEVIARGLARRIVGRVVEAVHLSRGDVVHGCDVPMCAVLRGRRIVGVERVGKQVRIYTDGTVAVGVHLGMSGRLTVADRAEPIAPHTHLRITFRGRRAELRFCDPRRFGGIWLLNGAAETAPSWVGRRLPPAGVDPLRITRAAWRALLRRRRQIKALLLDQHAIGGVGNIYCDEALHRAGVHPLMRADALGDGATGRLRRTLRRVLTEAIRAGGSSISDYRTADNAPGTYQHRHRVYARAGQPCRACGKTIERIVVAGRGTYLCPRCQPPPRGA